MKNNNAMKHSEKRWRFLLIISLLILLFSGCAVSQRTCVKNETPYCNTRGNFTGQWYNFYERGLSCMEGECYQDALSDLDEAISRRYEDQRRARTLGMHFADYFPHREKGLIHYLQGDHDEAKKELELSIRQYPSEKAFFYLDEVRKKIMAQAQQRLSVPKLTLLLPKGSLEENDIWTRDDPIIISGIAADKAQYISEIILAEKPIFIESSQQHIEFAENLTLDQGKHEIAVIARNLLGGETTEQFTIHVDRAGPVILLEKFIPGKSLEASLYDESGDISLWINEKPIDISKREQVRFQVALKPDEHRISLLAKDKLGNQTEMYLDESVTVFNISDTLTVQHQNEMSDTGKIFLCALPEITIKGVQGSLAQETVFKESITIPLEIKSENHIEILRINDVPQPIYGTGKIISLNYFARLKPGENKIHIAVRDAAGNTSEKELRILRKIPEVFQLKHRYSLVMHPFDSTDGRSEQAWFQYCFLDDLLARNRFQIFIRKELEKILDKGTLFAGDRNKGTLYAENHDLTGVSSSVILGIIYETRNGVEIAGRLVDIETRETIATADVYDDSNEEPALAAMAKRLSEKFHRSLPLIDCNISQILDNRLVITPEKRTPAKGEIRKELPLIVYREKIPENREYGSDTEIVCNASMDAVSENGDILVIVKEDQESKIRPGDKVISQ